MAAPRSFDPAPLGQVRVAFAQAQARRVAAGAMSDRSYRTYIRDIDVFAAFIGSDRVLDEVTEADIDDALVAYARSPDARFTPPRVQEKSPASIARYRASINALFAYADREGFLQRNPMAGTVVRPKVNAPAAHRTALTLGAAQAALAAPDGPMAVRDQVLLRVLMETGIRVGELCAADTADVTVVEGVPWLRIRHGKGGKQRDVPLTYDTHQLLMRYMEDRPGPWPKDPPERQEDSQEALLVTHRGRRITVRDVQNVCARAAARLPHEYRRAFTPHALRHTMATLNLAEGSADIATIQRLLGHSSLAVTGRYLDEVRDSMARAVADNPVTGDH